MQAKLVNRVADAYHEECIEHDRLVKRRVKLVPFKEHSKQYPSTNNCVAYPPLLLSLKQHKMHITLQPPQKYDQPTFQIYCTYIATVPVH